MNNFEIYASVRYLKDGNNLVKGFFLNNETLMRALKPRGKD